jgi:hypothetical protein
VGKSHARNPTQNPTPNRPKPGPAAAFNNGYYDGALSARARGFAFVFTFIRTVDQKPTQLSITPTAAVVAAHTTITPHPTPSLQSPPDSPITRGGMAHEEQNDPVAQSRLNHPPHPQLTCPKGTTTKFPGRQRRGDKRHGSL